MEGWGLATLLTFGAGVVLGLLGGGGSMLIMPILLHVAGLDARQAIASSLVAVGLGAANGFAAHARKSNVDWRAGILFGLPGMAGGWMGGRLAQFVPGPWLVSVFAVLMIVAALSMLRGPRSATGVAKPLWMMALAGLGVGFMTGLVGAGGGFAVVPALVLIGGLPVQRAIGTSLLVIAAQAAAGFAGHLGHTAMNPWMIAVVSAASVLGSMAGARISGVVSAQGLRRGFAGLAFAVAIALLAGLWLGPTEAKTNDGNGTTPLAEGSNADAQEMTMWPWSQRVNDKSDDPQLVQAKEWLRQGALLVDVRTLGEYEDGHAPGARNIPVQELAQRVDEIPRGTKVVLYCRSGARSASASVFLIQEGFEVIDVGPLHRGMQLSASNDRS